jgi:cbb3-type cytochrome oxidase maturation protein
MLLLTVSGLLFWWTVKSGQYDDLDSPAQRILFDDDDHMIPGKEKKDSDDK